LLLHTELCAAFGMKKLMADAPHISNEAETRAFYRHAELVSASKAVGRPAVWTLKQVQGDGGVRG